jgi:hypothetical protein
MENHGHGDLDGLAKLINEEHRRLEASPRDRELMLRVGGLLSEAKMRCPDEAWQAWLEANFEGSEKRARELIDLHRADRLLREVLDFLSDDSHLTPEGLASRDRLLGDLEAIEQEHRLSD